MTKHVPATKIFGAPSLQLSTAIDDHDKTSRATAAHFRMVSRLRELEAHFTDKASEIRAAYLDEMAEAIGTPE